MKVINIIFFLFLTFKTYSQITYYQETCKCGVTGAGFSTAAGSGSGSFNVYVEPGSTIKKAYFFGIRFGEVTPSIQIPLNGVDFQFNISNSTNIEYKMYGIPQNKLITIHAFDITTFINPLITNYTVTIPMQINSCLGCKYDCVYLYVLYENPIFTENITSYVLLNNKDEQEIVDYELSNFNPINLGSPLSFATYFDRIGADIPNDGSDLYFNNGSWQNAGLLKGGDGVNSVWDGGGVKGHFYYQNNTLFGLDDDTPDNTVGGTDGLIDVNTYIHPDGTLKWRLQWEAPLSTGRFNAYNGFFITHTTTCDTFTVTTIPDTTICPNSPLQLFATGGQTYEWTPATDLSCSDCPNPIFTGDSSQFYTVRIWNNDSCSVVRPVKVIVREEPQFGSISSTPTICGTNSGQVILSAQVGTATPISYSWNSGINQPSGTFSNLFDGNQLFTMQDGFGCTNDTLITVLENNPTIAQFTVNPASGAVPLTVSVSNTSQFATTYDWWLNDSNQGSFSSIWVSDDAERSSFFYCCLILHVA